MKLISYISKPTKYTLIVATILIAYSYLCRIVGIYFFWESSAVGWSLLMIGIFGLLSANIRLKKATIPNMQPERILLEKIAKGFTVFILLVMAIVYVAIYFVDANKAAIQYLTNNKQIQDEVGVVKEVVHYPIGGVAMSSSSKGSSGNATLSMTIKGSKKYKDVTVYLSKNIDSANWAVDEVEN